MKPHNVSPRRIQDEDPQKVVLLDTPAFDYTFRREEEVLKAIADGLE
jgi:hypothetical protein